MENMARLAVLERKLRTRHIFNEVLTELYQILSCIINNPNDEGARTVTNSILSRVYDCEAFSDYMEYIGFEKISNQYVFPREKGISKLEIAHAALDKKINYINGCEKPGSIALPYRQEQLESHESITLGNPFLMHIQNLFHEMRKYEDKELQEEAKKHIPLAKLQIKAMERMREHQKKIKAGKTQVPDIAFEIALLMELLGWFKYEFFHWVNEPECDSCQMPTKLIQTIDGKNVGSEICRVEVYECRTCRTVINFPRFNNPGTLLKTRRGRCGEWANCFTLLCRALDYDTRYVYDVTDHVWCEVYDIVSKSWLHVDPCEGKLDKPLMYCHGWGKKLSYVFAFSQHDLQDVTWRYTTNHKEVLSRRTSASEEDIINTILRLRMSSYQKLSPARQKFLTIRNIAELASLMVERNPSDFESQGRISGSIQWRAERGEIGNHGNHSFVFNEAGEVGVQYCTSADKYRVTRPGAVGGEQLATWAAGVRDAKSVFRKVEMDWRQVYLARNETEDIGSVSWHIKTETADLKFIRLAIRLTCAVYENGNIDWTIQFDDKEPECAQFNDSVTQFERSFRSVTIRAMLSGGLGDLAWQHAQLFRQSLDDRSTTFEIQAKIVAE